MASITTQDLQDIAVSCTSQFLNQGTPLATSLAKEASLRGLNLDQVRRAVEATNTLTYLKSIQVSGDRTSEFPVAEFSEVVKQASIPEGIDKVASIQEAPQRPAAAVVSAVSGFAKLAELSEEALSFDMPSLTLEQAVWHLQKEAQVNSRRVEELEVEAEVVRGNLLKLARELGGATFQEKLSTLNLSDSQFTKVAKLVTGEPLQKVAFAETLLCARGEVDHLPGGRWHTKAASLIGQLDSAEQLVSELHRRKELEPMVKQAFLGALADLTGRAVGGAIRGTAGLVGRGISSAASGTVDAAKTGIQNQIAATKIGKELGVPTTAQTPGFKRTVGAASLIGSAGADALSFTPKDNAMTGRSGDVWSSLQS